MKKQTLKKWKKTIYYLNIKLMIIVYKILNITHTKHIQIKKSTQFKS